MRQKMRKVIALIINGLNRMAMRIEKCAREKSSPHHGIDDEAAKLA